MKTTSLLLVLLLLLTGCASQSIAPSYYLMRSNMNMETRTLNNSADFSMGTIAIAPYIDQPGLVMETIDGNMHAASHNLWAEPVYDGIRNQLLVEISQAMGEDLLPVKISDNRVVLDIRIDQLHGTADGKARLVAYWWLRRDKELLSAYQFAENKLLTADGYGALVAAEQDLLSELASKIAATMVVTDT